LSEAHGRQVERLVRRHGATGATQTATGRLGTQRQPEQVIAIVVRDNLPMDNNARYWPEHCPEIASLESAEDGTTEVD
jgi:hypothetical protein